MDNKRTEDDILKHIQDSFESRGLPSKFRRDLGLNVSIHIPAVAEVIVTSKETDNAGGIWTMNINVEIAELHNPNDIQLGQRYMLVPVEAPTE